MIKLEFTTVGFNVSDLPKLRGFFSRHFSENIEFHNHLPDGSFSYKYPVIQYRVIKGHPALIGIKEGIELIKSLFFELDELIINERKYQLPEKEIMLKEQELGECEEFISYRFASPWMALNQDNYILYREKNKVEQQQFLKLLLRENLKSLCKGFGYWIEDIENVKVEGYFKEKLVNFKNRKMVCFTGEFTTNFKIPQYLGIGKQSARGFGVVERVEEEG
ncbi:MAG: CRISPR-associated endonuclease Cas6 [Candidatus Stygibacter australis]|nr:CRISPR-associated endonuclease Cas6 [Candidatus Stygibacter australis]